MAIFHHLMKIVYYRMINVMSNRKYLPMEAC
nr:MAG TPA: hypothetical protein [Caudoviricetes sp.]